MPFPTKLAAVVASAVVLAGGGTATVVAMTPPAPGPVVTATPEPASTDVRVWADSRTYLVSLTNPTVAEALAAAGVTLNATDRVDRELDAVLAKGDIVSVQRVTTTQQSRVTALEFATVRQNDATLDKGTTKVKTKGVAGERTDIVEVVTVDGQVTTETVVSSSTTKEPVAQVVLVGTKTSGTTSRSAARPATTTAKAPVNAGNTSGAGINLANAAMWDRIAKCESGGNWSINTGNGYYGGLQFSLATWRSVKGTDFAAYPHQASRAEQITVANRLYAQRGLQPWGCRGAA